MEREELGCDPRQLREAGFDARELKEAGLIQGENRRGSVVYTLNMSTLEEALHTFMGRMGLGRAEGEARPGTKPQGETQ